MRTSVDVHNHLVGRNVPHELVRLRGRLRSPERIASVLDLPPDQVGRVVVCESDRGPLAVVVASDRKPDLDLVSKAARAGDVKSVTGAKVSQLSEYLPDAVPPVGLPEGFGVVVDRPLAQQDILYFAAGDGATILKVRGADLVRAASAKVGRISS